MITPSIDPKGNYTIHPKLVAVDAINALVRGETSAVEAYGQVLEKISEGVEQKRLLEILDYHKELVTYWKMQVVEKNMSADTSSGLWGVVVEGLVGTAKVFGNLSSLQILKKGEEHGLQEYRNFLDNEFVTEKNKKYVREVVIPRLEMNINSLNAMASMQ